MDGKRKKTYINLLVIGDGEEKENTIALCRKLDIEKQVFFLGWKENPYPFIEISDALVLSSKYEGFGNVLVEALACGVPIIASDVGGVGEALTPETGRLISRGDKQVLKKALIELIENADLREIMGQNARKRVEQEFSLEKMLEKTEQDYRGA